MTLAKRLLLGTAAAFVATSGAHAADLGLPVAPSVDYVQVCSIGSFTGFLLPGSDVCFDISGFARGEATWGEEIDPFAYATVPGADATAVIDLTGVDIEAATTNVNVAILGSTVDLNLDGTVTQAEVYDALDRNAARLAGYSSLVQFTDAGNTIDNVAGALDIAARAGTADSITFDSAALGFGVGDSIVGFGALYNALVGGTGSTEETERDEFGIVGDARLNFDARTMTEYGLLRGFIRLDGNGDGAPNIEHAYVQLNVGSLGFTAGLAASTFDPLFTGYGAGARNGLMLGDDANEQFSVNMAVGNGVTVSLSVEEERTATFVTQSIAAGAALGGGDDVYTLSTAATDSGQSIPDFIAAVRVDQAWGSAKVAGVLTELNPAGSAIDSEFGYALAASAEFNIPVGVGSTFGLTGIYSHGANGYIDFNNSVGNTATGDANAIITTTTVGGATTTSLDLTTAYVLAAGFNFGVSDMLSLSLDGAYADIDHEGTLFDGNTYTIRGGVQYTPVNNLALAATVTYTASDFNTTDLRANADDDEWGARFRVTRSF